MNALKFPLPKPDIAAYNEILQHGLDKYPQRKDNFNLHKICSRNIHIKYMPIKMDIEPVSRCNLNCDMCQMATFKNRKRAEDLSFDDFKDILSLTDKIDRLTTVVTTSQDVDFQEDPDRPKIKEVFVDPLDKNAGSNLESHIDIKNSSSKEKVKMDEKVEKLRSMLGKLPKAKK